mgnify:CR=1 FL=1
MSFSIVIVSLLCLAVAAISAIQIKKCLERKYETRERPVESFSNPVYHGTTILHESDEKHLMYDGMERNIYVSSETESHL